MSALSSWQSDLRHLQEVFRAGYSGYPPLSVCRVAGKVPGDLDRNAIDPYWPVLLKGRGQPWRQMLTLAVWADPPRDSEHYPVYDCYWMPQLDLDPAPVERRFFELGAQAAEVLAEAGRLGYQIGRSRPIHAGQGHHWLNFLFRLAWESTSRVLQAPRFRLHYNAEENTYLFANWHEEMDGNPSMIQATVRHRDVNPAYASQPWGNDIWTEAKIDPQAKLAFPHRYFSYLEDLFQASASAIELLLAEPPPIAGGVTKFETAVLPPADPCEIHVETPATQPIPSRFRAGEAFLQAAKDDPKTREALKRAVESVKPRVEEFFAHYDGRRL